MARFLILLCPPRSFSSVVSTMIGQHPDMYGFPELHLFMGDTVAAVMEWELSRGKPLGPPGLLRALAQLGEGRQDEAAVLEAHRWLAARAGRPVAQVLDHLARLAGEDRLLVEKTPAISLVPQALRRAHALCPDALFLHLTRHPADTCRSLAAMAERPLAGARWQGLAPAEMWIAAHQNILAFAAALAPGRCLRLRGEDLLSDPGRWLPQIAAWAGVSTNPAALAAMKRPEDSPYARPGPANARGGNDGAFMRSPALRPGPVKSGDLAAWLYALPADLRERARRLAGVLGYRA